MSVTFQLKPLSSEGVAEALQKAERYRLLNEPRLAESICHDILNVEPTNEEAIIMLLLAITDQFGEYSSASVDVARRLIPLLKSEYERLYYAGIICERQGSAILRRGLTGGNFVAFEWLTDAMEFFEKAGALSPAGNDDAILRWNTCAREIMRHHLEPRIEEFAGTMLE
jgi:hypothetical protein